MPPPEPSTAPRLGELEACLLKHLWKVESGTAKSVHEAVGRSRGISLNTVQSTLDRLQKKQLLRREKVSRAFRYSASVSCGSLLAAMVSEAAARFSEDSSTAMAALIDAAEQLDHAALDELERMIAARRAEAENGHD
jgi:predicted transcriptional regulator